jgi:nucleoside-diphosphate-sugar epimerase
MYHPPPPPLFDIKAILSTDFDWEYFKNKTVLITGANGLIASYLVYTLVWLNETVCRYNKISIIALVRNQEKAERKFFAVLQKKYFRLMNADVCESLDLNGKIDVIIHAASQASPKYYGIDPVGTLKANTIGTANMLNIACKNDTEKFIFLSSSEVYGVLDAGLTGITESYMGNVDITNVRSCYAESKRMGETMCVCWAHQYNLHTNMVRISGTYGPGIELDDGRAFVDFVRNIITNEDILLNSDGSARRNYVYITDTILAIFFILFYGKKRHAYNISGDSEITIFELATLLCELYPEKHLSIKFSQNVSSEGYIRSVSMGAGFCNDKLKKLGWKQCVSLADGFRRMIESYRQNTAEEWIDSLYINV